MSLHRVASPSLRGPLACLVPPHRLPLRSPLAVRAALRERPRAGPRGQLGRRSPGRSRNAARGAVRVAVGIGGSSPVRPRPGTDHSASAPRPRACPAPRSRRSRAQRLRRLRREAGSVALVVAGVPVTPAPGTEALAPVAEPGVGVPVSARTDVGCASGPLALGPGGVIGAGRQPGRRRRGADPVVERIAVKPADLRAAGRGPIHASATNVPTRTNRLTPLRVRETVRKPQGPGEPVLTV